MSTRLFEYRIDDLENFVLLDRVEARLDVHLYEVKLWPVTRPDSALLSSSEYHSRAYSFAPGTVKLALNALTR